MKTSISVGLVGFVLLCVLAACVSSGGAVMSPMGSASGSAAATAPGFGGDVTVAITMANGYITDVTIAAPGETPSVGGIAVARAPGIIKQNNSADIDALSGATVTTHAISTAAQAAIDTILAGEQ
jgi:fumarate reductase flavoprotein subunit